MHDLNKEDLSSSSPPRSPSIRLKFSLTDFSLLSLLPPYLESAAIVNTEDKELFI